MTNIATLGKFWIRARLVRRILREAGYTLVESLPEANLILVLSPLASVRRRVPEKYRDGAVILSPIDLGPATTERMVQEGFNKERILVLLAEDADKVVGIVEQLLAKKRSS